MSLPALTGLIDQLTAQRDEQRRQLEGELRVAKNSGREALLPSELRSIDNLKAIDDRIRDLTEENRRAGTTPLSGKSGRQASSAGRLSPLGFTDESLRQAHAKICRGETAILESRDFVSAVGELPAQLFPIPTFPRHEDRLLDAASRLRHGGTQPGVRPGEHGVGDGGSGRRGHAET